jgi:hypothetical protein
MKRFLAFVAACVVCGPALAAALCAAEQQKIVPKEVQEHLGYFVGTWTIEGKYGPAKVSGEISIRWSREKHVTIGDWSVRAGEERFHVAFVCGWDSSTGALTEQGIGVDGTVYTCRYTIESPNVLKGDGAGSCGGKTITDKVRFEKKGPNQFTWTMTDTKRGDEVLPDWELKYTKAPQKPKP